MSKQLAEPQELYRAFRKQFPDYDDENIDAMVSIAEDYAEALTASLQSKLEKEK